eukprot:TRINITY_DN9838_c0_g1_i5.p2 TRINITY_DN9838_c0_g1~~TRINITY_DN9838_c0_g1_i5.p2  ORF type:complete len:189 (+),score=-4.85 TRINITY_DN9838_c0_g1_i5:532-1098(+)
MYSLNRIYIQKYTKCLNYCKFYQTTSSKTIFHKKSFGRLAQLQGNLTNMRVLLHTTLRKICQKLAAKKNHSKNDNHWANSLKASRSCPTYFLYKELHKQSFQCLAKLLRQSIPYEIIYDIHNTILSTKKKQVQNTYDLCKLKGQEFINCIGSKNLGKFGTLQAEFYTYYKTKHISVQLVWTAPTTTSK